MKVKLLFIVLTANLFNSAWAISGRHAESYIPIVAKLIKGEKISRKDMFFGDRSIFKSSTAAVIGGQSNSGQTGTSKTVGIVPVIGPIMKYDTDCGPIGTQTMGAMLQNLYDNQDVDAIVIKGDTPGGMVDGTKDLADIIAAKNKPVIWFVDGLTASAGMWLASQCDLIIASQNISEIGSIGTMCSLADIKPALEKLGVVFHEVYATDSVDKNKDYAEMLAGNYDLIKAQLDVINASFIADVKNGRGSKVDTPENVFTGKIYFANDAIKYGLVDSIGNFDFALQQAAQLAAKNNSITLKFS